MPITYHAVKAANCTVSAEITIEVAFLSSANRIAVGIRLQDWAAAWGTEAVVAIIRTGIVVTHRVTHVVID
jgi:hypothetical protein